MYLDWVQLESKGVYPVSSKVYIFRHIVFDELCFPFNKNINKDDIVQPTVPDLTTFPNIAQWSKETKETDHQSLKENITMSHHPKCRDTCCEILDASTNQDTDAFIEQPRNVDE